MTLWAILITPKSSAKKAEVFVSGELKMEAGEAVGGRGQRDSQRSQKTLEKYRVLKTMCVQL